MPDKYSAYLFAYFKGDPLPDGEQIYFAISKDGFHWTDLNSGKPILTSTLGDKGLRDPFILRSHDDSKFYLIATDLKTMEIIIGIVPKQEAVSLLWYGNLQILLIGLNNVW